MSFAADVITLFPELFPGPLGASVIGRGAAQGLWSLRLTQLRDFATDRHHSVDDTPAGGGAGMVLKPDVLAAAIDAVSHQNDPRPRLLMSPRGRPLTQARARALANGPGAVIVCDVAMAAHAGAALSLIPPRVAEESVKDGELSEMLASNFAEVLNVASQLFHGADGHARLVDVRTGADPGDAAAAAVQSPVGRLDLTVDIAGYGTGALSLLVA